MGKPALQSFSSFCSDLLSFYDVYCRIVSGSSGKEATKDKVIKKRVQVKKDGIGRVRRSKLATKVNFGKEKVRTNAAIVRESNPTEVSSSGVRKDFLPDNIVPGKEVQLVKPRDAANVPTIKQISKHIASQALSSEVLSNQVFVCNLPFETSVDWVRNFFGTYGEIQACSVPRRPNRGGRYFGFVTFSADSAASQAVASLNGYKINGYQLLVALARPPSPRIRSVDPGVTANPASIPEDSGSLVLECNRAPNNGDGVLGDRLPVPNSGGGPLSGI